MVSDDDEPYSPGDSDEEFQKPLSIIQQTTLPAKPDINPDDLLKNKSVEEKLKEVEKAIAARKLEIDMLENKKKDSMVSDSL